MSSYTIKAPAKLNLRLKVTGRNNDGYHVLSMLNVPISIFDTLKIDIREGSGIELNCTGISANVKENENIVFRAAQDFFKKNCLESFVSIKLHKEIPVGAGLGGGSSNAAAVLKILHNHFNIALEGSDYKNLGADVPYMLNPIPAWVWGIGELMRPIKILDSQKKNLVLCIPAQSLSTKEVFIKYSQMPSYSQREDALYLQPELHIERIGELVSNDLFASAASLYPALESMFLEIRSQSEGIVSLSGSGSAFFCLIEADTIEKELDKIKKIMLKYGGIALPVSIMYPSGATGR